MKRSKKNLMISLLLCAIAAIGAGACTQPAQEPTPQNPPPTEPTEPNLDHVTEVIDDEAEFKKIFQSSEAGAKVEGYYLLGCDITLTEPWTNTATLCGTLDGGGYTISGLSLSAKSGLFSALDEATIKDVSVVDAVLGGEQSGVFAFASSKATFENVYVSVAGTVFGEFYETKPHKYVLSDQSQKSGLIYQGDNTELTLKNSVIYMPEHLTKASGFICAYGSPKLTVTGSTFIGGNGALVGTRSDKTTAPTYTDGGKDYVTCDAVKAYKDLYGTAICVGDKIMKDIPEGDEPANARGWSAMIVAAYQANHPLKVFEARDFTEENFVALKSDIIVLNSDVTLSQTALGIDNDDTNAAFTGVFDGQGYEISGIVSSGNKGGLFKRLSGSMKNLAVHGYGTNSGGVLADVVIETAYIENVYLEATSGSRCGNMVARWIKGATSLSMKDVVINVEDFTKVEIGAMASLALDSGRTQSMGIYMDNCYCTASEKRPIGCRDKDTKYLTTKVAGVEYFFWDVGDTVGGTVMTVDDGLKWYLSDELNLFIRDVNRGTIQLSDFLKTIVLSL